MCCQSNQDLCYITAHGGLFASSIHPQMGIQLQYNCRGQHTHTLAWQPTQPSAAPSHPLVWYLLFCPPNPFAKRCTGVCVSGFTAIPTAVLEQQDWKGAQPAELSTITITSSSSSSQPCHHLPWMHGAQAQGRDPGHLHTQLTWYHVPSKGISSSA